MSVKSMHRNANLELAETIYHLVWAFEKSG